MFCWTIKYCESRYVRMQMTKAVAGHVEVEQNNVSCSSRIFMHAGAPPVRIPLSAQTPNFVQIASSQLTRNSSEMTSINAGLVAGC